MTTAPDLPLPAPALDEAPAGPPLLSIVPAQPGPDEDFESALRRATPWLRRYATRRLGDPHEAEEVVQEALLRAFQHRELLATEDDLMAWLTVVTGRLAIDRLRVRSRSTSVAELPAGIRVGRDTADVVVAREEARLALDALEAMPARQASVLWAREVEGLSYDDIGARFDLSEPSVRSLLHRARRTLRREYAARGGTLPAIGLVALAPWLHGLRQAGRLRHLVKRGTSAAAVAATGLAVATVVPFGGGHPAPAQAAPAPALRIKAAEVALPHRHHSPARHVAAGPRAMPTATDVRTAETAHRLATPAVCGRDVAAGCETHHSPTVYVKLPVSIAGRQWIGVASNKASCALVPATPVTQCDPTQGETK